MDCPGRAAAGDPLPTADPIATLSCESNSDVAAALGVFLAHFAGPRHVTASLGAMVCRQHSTDS